MYILMTIEDYATFDFPEIISIPYKMNYIVFGGFDSGSEYFFLNLN